MNAPKEQAARNALEARGYKTQTENDGRVFVSIGRAAAWPLPNCVSCRFASYAEAASVLIGGKYAAPTRNNPHQFNADEWPDAEDHASAFAWFMLNHEKPDNADGVELAACVDVGDGCMERVEAGEWQAALSEWMTGDANVPCPIMFSVYWHLFEGGADCFADFRNERDARLFAYYVAERHGLELGDHL